MCPYFIFKDRMKTTFTSDTMPYGKHKGKKLTKVPQSYLRWILEQSTALNEDIRLVLGIPDDSDSNERIEELEEENRILAEKLADAYNAAGDVGFATSNVAFVVTKLRRELSMKHHPAEKIGALLAADWEKGAAQAKKYTDNVRAAQEETSKWWGEFKEMGSTIGDWATQAWAALGDIGGGETMKRLDAAEAHRQAGGQPPDNRAEERAEEQARAQRAAELEAIAQRQIAKNVSDTIEALDQKSLILRYGADQAERMRLAEKGAKDWQLEDVEMMQRWIKGIEAANDLWKESRTLLESLKSPTERFFDEWQRINDMALQGFLTEEEQGKALAALSERFDVKDMKAASPQFAQQGTVQATSAITAARNATAEQRNKEVRQIKEDVGKIAGFLQNPFAFLKPAGV
jgi:uncharacterized protein (UPF0335 family)